ELSLIDLADKRVVDVETVRQSWYGLALDVATGRVWWSGGGGNPLHTFELKDRDLAQVGDREPMPEPEKSKEARKKAREEGAGAHFKSGLALAPDGGTLYSLDIDGGAISATAPDGRRPPGTATVGV